MRPPTDGISKMDDSAPWHFFFSSSFPPAVDLVKIVAAAMQGQTLACQRACRSCQRFGISGVPGTQEHEPGESVRPGCCAVVACDGGKIPGTDATARQPTPWDPDSRESACLPGADHEQAAPALHGTVKQTPDQIPHRPANQPVYPSASRNLEPRSPDRHMPNGRVQGCRACIGGNMLVSCQWLGCVLGVTRNHCQLDDWRQRSAAKLADKV